MAAAIAQQQLNEVYMALTVCQIPPVAQIALTNMDGFINLDLVGMLENDDDVTSLASRMQRRPMPGGVNVFLGHVHIKNLQTLAWWVRDRQKQGLPLYGGVFTQAVMDAARVRKLAERDRPSTSSVSISDLPKFKAADFDIQEDAFLNLLSSTLGVNHEPIRYITRAETPPVTFVDDAERRRYSLSLTDAAFVENNKTVFRMLKTYLVNSEGWPWIANFNETENGRGAYLAWAGHYNGDGEFNKRAAVATKMLKRLHYKNEKSFPFERYVSTMSNCFLTLNKNARTAKTPYQQVQLLLDGIKVSDPEIRTIKTMVRERYQEDFLAASDRLAQEVSLLYEDKTPDSEGQGSGRKRYISALGGRGDSGGRGRGRFGGGRGGGGRSDGRGRFHGGRGGRFGSRGGGSPRTPTILNGVDITDVHRNFNNHEWNALRNGGGLSFVMYQREHSGHGGRFGGRSPAGGGGRGNDNTAGRSVGALEQQPAPSPAAGTDHNNVQVGANERGHQHGNSFGRGAYGRGGRGHNVHWQQE